MQTSSHDRNLSFSNPDQITIKRTKPKINSEDSKKLTLITEVSQTIKEQIKQENIGLNSNRNAINLDQSKFGRPETTYSGLLKNFTIDEDSSRNNRSTLPKFSRPSFILDKIVHETPNENLHDRKRSMTSGDLLDRNVLVSGPNSESQQILVGKLTDDGTLNNKLAIESNNSKSENRRKSMLSGSTSFKKEYPHLHRIKTTKENFSIISEQSAEQNSVTQAIQNDQIPASELLIGQDGNAQTPGSRLSRKSFYNNDSTPIDSDVNDRTSGLLRPNRTRISRKQKTEINDIVNTTDFDDDKSLSLPTAENIKAMKNRNKLIIKKLTSTNDVSESMLQFVALNTKAVMSLDFAKEETILNSPSSSNEDNSKVIQPTEQEIPKTTILPLVAPKTENEDYKLVEIKKSTKPSQNSKSASVYSFTNSLATLLWKTT
ncbi:hypothetical protein BC833DRAFT_253844 [Globomyces pollinis-pini]|nr:hypothetical protein BC833DRAFT_253844 [Globomyces pollinis-pini]